MQSLVEYGSTADGILKLQKSIKSVLNEFTKKADDLKVITEDVAFQHDFAYCMIYDFILF